MAFDGSYDFRVRPYTGDLNRYSRGPAHQWFDFYAPDENGGPDDQEPIDPGHFEGGPQDGGGSDGGNVSDVRGQGRDQATAASFGDFAKASIMGLGGVFGGPLGMAALGPSIIAGEPRGIGPSIIDQISDMLAGQNQTGKAVNTAEQLAGLSPPGYDDAENAQIANEVTDAYGGGFSMGDGRTGDGYNGGQDTDDHSADAAGDRGFKNGGIKRRQGALPPPRFIRGPGDGRSDGVYANGGKARLSNGEMVIPADAVSAAGRGSSEAGARQFSNMVQRLRGQHMNRMSALPPPGR